MTNDTSSGYCSDMMRIYGSKPNDIRKLFEYGRKKAQEIGSENVFDLSIGNPSVPPPPAVKEALLHLLDHENPLTLHGYTSANGAPEVRQTIADSLNREFGISCGMFNIYMAAGAAAALSVTFRALMNENEHNDFMAIAPHFPEYRSFADVHGASLTVIPPELPDFDIPVRAIEEALTPRTRGIVVNSPNNPTGRLYKTSELEALAEVLDRKSEAFGHPIYLISDEPYRYLVYDGKKTPFIPKIYRNTIICYSYSKSLSIPGERIGYVFVPPEADHSEDVYNAVAGAGRTLGYVCAPSLMQRVAALCADTKPNITQYDENRKTLYRGLLEAGYDCVRPEGAFYMFIKAPGGDAYRFSDFARLRYNLLIVPSDGFGCPGYLRVSYCVSNDRIRKALPLLAECLEKFKEENGL